jgi:hypothetical protein
MNDLLARVIAAHGGLDTKIIAKTNFFAVSISAVA